MFLVVLLKRFPLCACGAHVRRVSNQPQRYSLVGPPDGLSNIRPINHRPPSCKAEAVVQALERDVWAYNHDFWSRHNTEFRAGKEEYARQTGQGVAKLSTQELSAYYKAFLNDKYNEHVAYTRGWLKLQSELTWSLLKLNLRQLSTVFTRNKNR